MNTLDFENVYLTIFTSKVVLCASGFILFAIATYITLWWIRRSYVAHFGGGQNLPPAFPNRKISNWLMIAASILMRSIGSSIVHGVGREPALQMLEHASFGK